MRDSDDEHSATGSSAAGSPERSSAQSSGSASPAPRPAPPSARASSGSSGTGQATETSRPTGGLTPRLLRRWWDAWPGRLEAELGALDSLGAKYERDPEAWRHGVLRLHISHRVQGQPIRLEVTFPDLYPYFRFEIRAPDERLPYHQHPVSHNLCLLGRRTDNWDVGFTVAQLLAEQLPNVLYAGRSDDPLAVADIEEHQAEPYSDYYPYDIWTPSTLLVDGNWKIDAAETSGTLEIGLVPPSPGGTPSFVRGAVLQVRTNNDIVLERAAEPIRDRFRDAVAVGARWVQLSEPLREVDPTAVLEEIKRRDPGARLNPENPVFDGKLQLWGVVFPEESQWRNRDAQGWFFIARFEKRVAAIPPGANIVNPRPKQRRHRKDGKPWRR